jgi:hypothetical protein
MLTTFFVVAAFSAFSEIAMAHKMPRFRHWNANTLFNVISSTVLSALFSLPFGGGGVLISVTAAMSTAMTIPYYQFMDKLDHADPETMARYQGYLDDLKMTGKMIMAILWVCYKILSFPAWFPRWCKKVAAPYAAQINAAVRKVRAAKSYLINHIPTALRGAHS